MAVAAAQTPGPRKSCTVTISYAPASVGESDSGTLTATAKKATASLALLGTAGSAGCIVVRQPGASVIPDC